MKLSTLFWGILFVVLGGLFLLNNLEVLDVDWGTVLNLWPLILVFWGVSLVLGKQRPRWYTVAFMIFLIVFLVFGAFIFEFFKHIDYFNFGGTNHQTFVEPYSPDVQRASFTFEAGAGGFFLEDTTSQLIDASTQVGFGKYVLDTDRSGDTEYLSLKLKGRTRRWNFGRLRNRADIKLNTSPVWDINIEVGASSLRFDLSPYKTDRIKIEAGAASLKLKLGERSEETRVRVQAGASSIDIEVPSLVGCEVRATAPLSSKRLPGFDKVGGGRYETSNFETAAKKIYIDVEAGVSSLRVHRY